MKTKIFLLIDGARTKGSLPHEDADHAVIEGECPHCKATPFKVQGTGRRIASDDRAYEADGISVCCSRFVGIIRVEINTLFGVREDEAVMRSGVRIY